VKLFAVARTSIIASSTQKQRSEPMKICHQEKPLEAAKRSQQNINLNAKGSAPATFAV
jgi:hypothetical protein